ncbi:MAG: multiheme c-type cytochrome [bacterium]
MSTPATGRGARVRAAIFRQLFAFTALDGFYLVALYALGSYSILDAPLHLGVFGGSWWLLANERPRARALGRFLLVATTSAMAVSGTVVAFLPRYTQASFNLRVLHQLGGRPYLALVLPYLLTHVRRDVAGLGVAERWVARVGWLAVKLAFWVGAYVSLLTVGGPALPVHRVALALGAPLVVLHVVWAVRRTAVVAPASAPAPSASGVRWRGLVVAATVGCMLVALDASSTRELWFEDGDGAPWVRARVADFAPSLARTSTGGTYRAEALGGSNACGHRACHPSVYSEWLASPHRASVGDGYRVALEQTARTFGIRAARVCGACHDPISLFSGEIAPGGGLVAPEALREGISCLACHRLRAHGEGVGDGALELSLPRWYLRTPLSLMMMVGVWREHAEDFGVASADAADARCLGCHRFTEFPPTVPADLARQVLQRPEHAGQRRIDACRGTTGCTACHMARIGIAEKPGPALPSHRFDPPREAARVD